MLYNNNLFTKIYISKVTMVTMVTYIINVFVGIKGLMYEVEVI